MLKVNAPAVSIIKQFPDIDKECILSQKVRDTIQSLSSFEIFKIA